MDKTTRFRATQLAAVLKSQGRHQRWLAKQLGLHESYLSRVISGEKTLSIEQAERAASLLGVPLFLVGELLSRNDSDRSVNTETAA